MVMVKHQRKPVNFIFILPFPYSKVLPSVPSNTWMSTREVLASGGGAGKETVNPRDKKLQVCGDKAFFYLAMTNYFQLFNT